MQRVDGAFHHKLTKACFAPFIMPQEDRETEYLMPVSHCATGAACACLALASRIYRAFDVPFANRMLLSALRGWDWLKSHPDFVPFKNPENVRTGQYSDRNDTDERFWAACELYAATGEVLQQLGNAGMNSIYLTADSWKRDRNMLRESLKRLNLRVGGMHAFCDFASDPETLRYREIIELAVESGADNLLLIPGMLTSGNTCRDLVHMIEGMKRAVEYGRTVGIPVLMEDFDGLLSPYNCIAGLKYFLDSVEELGCAFDTGNFVAFHEDELTAFEMFADRIQTVHLKDRSLMPQHEGNTPFVCADGEKVYACSIGGGFIRIPDILQRLRSGNYHGNLIIELYACDPRWFMTDALDSLSWLRKQLKE